MTSFYQRISGGLFKQRASAGPQGMFSDFVHCLCFCGAYTDQNHNIHIKGCMEVFLRWLSLNLVVERWPKDNIIAKLSPAQSNSSSVGWAEIVLMSNFTPVASYNMAILAISQPFQVEL